MKKVTTLSLAALLALSLAACDKKTEQAQSAQPAQTETQPVVNAEDKMEITISTEPTEYGAEDLKKLSDWEKQQSSVLTPVGQELNKQIQLAVEKKGSPAEFETSLKSYMNALSQAKSSLANLGLKDSEIQLLVDKKQELYDVSGQALTLTATMVSLKEPSQDVLKAYQQQLDAYSTKVAQLTSLINATQQVLEQKYPQK